MTIVLSCPPIDMVSGCSSKRETATTPGTVSRLGTCSRSYTSLNRRSWAGSTSMAALKRYRVWMGMGVTPRGWGLVVVPPGGPAAGSAALTRSGLSAVGGCPDFIAYPLGSPSAAPRQAIAYPLGSPSAAPRQAIAYPLGSPSAAPRHATAGPRTCDRGWADAPGGHPPPVSVNGSWLASSASLASGPPRRARSRPDGG